MNKYKKNGRRAGRTLPVVALAGAGVCISFSSVKLEVYSPIKELRICSSEANRRWRDMFSPKVQRKYPIESINWEAVQQAIQSMTSCIRVTHLCTKDTRNRIRLSRGTAEAYNEVVQYVGTWESTFFEPCARDAAAVVGALLWVANQGTWHGSQVDQLLRKLRRSVLLPRSGRAIRTLERVGSFLAIHLPASGTRTEAGRASEKTGGRATREAVSKVLTQLTIDEGSRRVSLGSIDVLLSAKGGFTVFDALRKARGDIVSYADLIRLIRPESLHRAVVITAATPELKNCVYHINEALRRARVPLEVLAVRGKGYQLRARPNQRPSPA